MHARWTWLFAVLGLALALRGGAAFAVQRQLDVVWKRQFVIEGDATGYWELAGRITRGESYEIYTPPRRVLRMPGFPLLLAMTRAVFGEWMLGTRLSLCVVGTGACGLVYWLGRDLVSERVGLIAAAGAAVSPVMVGFTPLVLSETLFAASLLGSLIALAALARWHGAGMSLQRDPSQLLQSTGPRPLTSALSPDQVETESARHAGERGSGLRSQFCGACVAVLSGVLIGVACFVRPSWLLAAPLFGVLLIAWSQRRMTAVLHAGLMMLGLVTVLLPWGLRNQRVTGHLVLTTLWAGPSLYDGLHPGATGDSDMTFYDRDNLLGRGMSEYEVDRHYRREAWAFVRENPGRTLQLALIKLGRYWSPVPNAEQFGTWPVRLAVAASFLPLAALALVGAWRMRRERWVLALSLGPILYFSALHMVFVSSLRYRLPAEYALLVLAAVGADVVWRKWSQTARPPGEAAA